SLLTGQQANSSIIDQWLIRLELSQHKHRLIGTFSKGMVQRLGIVLSLIHNPDIIIWDEPSSGLDPEGRKLVLDLIQEEKQKNKTFIISTHILSDIERTCDHLLVLKDGQLLLNQNIKDACSQYACKDVESLYLKAIQKELS
ncbi:MAG: ABC transporter ATP-binding protein, partial [Deltaproteobacteria bacterium]|nr:ABC transporter ATP-binding protein [Deltaproteobacteria bacterium]